MSAAGSPGGSQGGGEGASAECSWSDGVDTLGDASVAGAAPADVARRFRLQSHAVSRGRRACVSGAPVLSRAECARLVGAAEAHAAANGGWSTTRHSHAPTTDLEVHSIPGVLEWFNRACVERLFPLAVAAVPELKLRPSDVRVSDAFLVRYDADGGQV